MYLAPLCPGVKVSYFGSLPWFRQALLSSAMVLLEFSFLLILQWEFSVQKPVQVIRCKYACFMPIHFFFAYSYYRLFIHIHNIARIFVSIVSIYMLLNWWEFESNYWVISKIIIQPNYSSFNLSLRKILRNWIVSLGELRIEFWNLETFIWILVQDELGCLFIYSRLSIDSWSKNTSSNGQI